MTMKKLLYVALLFCCLSGALSLRFYTRKDKLCVTECKKEGEKYYWCRYNSGWDYCSIMKNVDYYGRACRENHPCGKRGYSYSWCYVDSKNNWGYCGTQKENFKVVASNGYYCIDKCRYYSSGQYYWCNTEDGWHYCSPQEGQDYRGKQCRPGHPCDKHDWTSFWCYVDSNNNWGYCGTYGESKHLTHKGYYCSTECEKHGEDYFWCESYNGWGYCSPAESSDSHGRACLANHDCVKHGSSYTWCKRNANGDWDHCGQILEDCTHTNQQSKRMTQPNQGEQQVIDLGGGEQLCEVNDLAHHIQTVWSLESNTGDVNPTVNGNNMADATTAISLLNLNAGDIPNNVQAGTLVKHNTVRIDLQGVINRGGIRYLNIQIQQNIRGPRNGRSTTIAAVLVPANRHIILRYIRRALNLSLQRHGTVVLHRG